MKDFIRNGNIVRIPAVILLGMWGAFESILGILQVLHIRPSGNPLFCMTGTFSNPGPFGGGIAIVAAIMIALLVKKKLRSAIVVLILCILVLPASMSRAAWLALAVAVAMVVLSSRDGKASIG